MKKAEEERSIPHLRHLDSRNRHLNRRKGVRPMESINNFFSNLDSTTVAIIIAVVAVIVLAAILIAVMRKRRSDQLKERFGSEYERELRVRGDRSKAETELINREKRVHSFALKTLSPETRNRYAAEWSAVQRHFVDDPAVSVMEADSLVNQVMGARGYPMADFEQRAADISVTCPGVVQNYRSARAIVVRHGRSQAGTEDLRQAMVYYRSLFDELLDLPDNAVSPRPVLHERAS
jgi:hypothetical protein